MAKKINFTNDDFIDWSKTEKIFSEDQPKQKFIKKKREERDYSWNHDVTAALQRAGIKTQFD